MSAFLVAVLAIVPVELTVRDHFHVVEVNHFFDENGRKVFDQQIFYDWCWYTERYQVQAWRLVKNPTFLPERDWVHGGYACHWDDGGFIRHVQADIYRESWTQYDPELAEREYMPKQLRPELRIIRLDKPSGAIRP